MAVEPRSRDYGRLDRSYLVEQLVRLAQVPTHVPLGHATLMAPDDPRLVYYVQKVVRPEIVSLGYNDLLDVAPNDLVVQVGTGETDRSLLIMNYTPAQHSNLMSDPFSGKVALASEYGDDRSAVFGQGVSQVKAHQAAMLAVLKRLREDGTSLRGRLAWAINNEGRSSHTCSNAILDALGWLPQFGLIQIGTGLSLSLGNRGRVDILVHVEGRAAHSSVPHEGISAIDGAAEVIHRLKRLSWVDHHHLLGGRHAVVYKVHYAPLAPHTLPSDAWLTIDYRLLPGDTPENAVDQVRSVLEGVDPYRITVTQDVCMLPALVAPEHPAVCALQAAHARVTGMPARTSYGQGSFDAGGPCARGVPTVMYGASGGQVSWVTISSLLTMLKSKRKCCTNSSSIG